MRKRLRKKKHLAEFIEWAVAVTVNMIPGADFDTFLDDWSNRLSKAIIARSVAGA